MNILIVLLGVLEFIGPVISVESFNESLTLGGDTYNVNAHWNRFKHTYQKRYKSTYEEYKRKVIFAKNLQDIVDHNQRYKLGRETYNKSIYSFADQTPDEIRKSKKGLIIPK
jgi:hypothetical protein